MELTAYYEKTIYQTADQGVIVGLYHAPDKSYILTGVMLPTTKKVNYTFTGEFVEHKKYGKQFRVTSYDCPKPTSEDGILEYLSGGMIKGIGKVLAKRIVDAYGEQTFAILDDDIERLTEIKGITPRKLEKIKSSYASAWEGRDSILAMTKKGISPRLSAKAYSVFKKNTLLILKERPYELCRVPGITFPMADSLMENATEEYELSYDRFCCCAEYVLMENENNGMKSIIGNRVTGSLSMEANDFGKSVLALLKRKTYTCAKVLEYSKKMQKEGKLFILNKDGKQYVYRIGLYNIEKQTADELTRLSFRTECKEDLDKKIKKAEKELGIELSEEQIEAVKETFKNNLSLIIGPPGTGKTTVLKVISHVYKQIYKKGELTFLAPTGKAAKKMKDATGYPAYTIHSSLQIGTDPIQDILEGEERKIESGLVIVDELSMLDIRVAYQLFHGISEDCRVLLCGDDEQLPSVGAGAVLRDIIWADYLPVTVLTKIYRQSEGSTIYQNSYKMRNGESALIYDKDFTFYEESDPEEAEERLIATYLDAINEYGIENVMLLTPFKEHSAGVKRLNERIQELLHPEAEQRVEFKHGFRVFRIGDIVMQLKNTEEQINGDTGTVISICKEEDEQSVVVQFDDGSTRSYSGEEMEELSLAYAYTVHKAQGSEAKCVIFFIHNMHSIMLKKNLVYTAITRARDKVILVGEKEALIKAINTTKAEKRNTGLEEFLTEEKIWRVG